MGYIEHIPTTRAGVEELIAYHVKLKKNNDQKLFLEIHTSLIGGEALLYSVPIDWFWDQLEPFSWEYKRMGMRNKTIKFDNAHQFIPSAQLIYLCRACDAAARLWRDNSDLAVRHSQTGGPEG